MLRLVIILVQLAAETVRWWGIAGRSQRSIEAEDLVLRRQLALYIERGVKPRRIASVTRISLALLSRFFNWRDALVVVRPETMIRWHRAGGKLFWRLKSRPGRPPIPLEIQTLIRRMANENPAWGQERIANERARPHMALGPGVPDSPTATHHNFNCRSRHRLREDVAVRANAVLGGLHHEYFLAPTVAPLSICG